MIAEPETVVAATEFDLLADAQSEARAASYSLLAALLRVVPDSQLLETLSSLELEDGGDALAHAVAGLRLAARELSLQEINDEYHALFVGLGRGELVPYGSWYLTGFLMEKPLGELRRDLELLGFSRQEGVDEPEDHVAALCEVMSMLIADAPEDIELQRTFFDKHLGCWAGRLFDDMEQAPSAVFYRAVARFGSALTDLEQRFLTLEI